MCSGQTSARIIYIRIEVRNLSDWKRGESARISGEEWADSAAAVRCGRLLGSAAADMLGGAGVHGAREQAAGVAVDGGELVSSGGAPVLL